MRTCAAGSALGFETVRFSWFCVHLLGVGESPLSRLLRGGSDANIRFNDLRSALLRLGFSERNRGSHHIFTLDGVEEILNLQPKGALAKPYQIKQVRKVLVRYKLGAGAE